MRKYRHYCHGFTLVELLFSMAIGTMVLLLAATMLRSSGEGYERVSGSVEVERETRALISQMTSDFSTAVYHKDQMLESSIASWPADKIGILSLQPAGTQADAGHIGDLCAVNYYMTDLTLGGKTVRCLMRGFRESKETFAAIHDDTVDSLFTPKESLDEPVAFGVAAFSATPKSRDPSGKWNDWVKNVTVSPDAIEIRLIIAHRSLISKFKTPTDWDGGSALLGLVDDAERNPYLEVYQTLIRFGNHANP